MCWFLRPWLNAHTYVFTCRFFSISGVSLPHTVAFTPVNGCVTTELFSSASTCARRVAYLALAENWRHPVMNSCRNWPSSVHFEAGLRTPSFQSRFSCEWTSVPQAVPPPGWSIFRHFRKIAKNYCLLRHVCPSVRMEQLCSHCMEFNEILHLNI
jgi:hypothetical protein